MYVCTQAARENLIGIVREWIAYLNSRFSSVEKLKELNSQDVIGYTPLHYAAKFNCFKILQKLEEEGAGELIHGIAITAVEEWNEKRPLKSDLIV